MGEIQKPTALEVVEGHLTEGCIAGTILSGLWDGLVIVDASGRPIRTNGAATPMHGFRDQENALREFERLLSNRAGVVGADLNIVSQPGGGTTVLCYLTLEHEQQHE